jgi:two-component system, LytTR family, sensor kinase
MKVRWREHEIIFVTILIVAQIIFSIFKIDSVSYKQVSTDFAGMFNENGFHFTYWKNVLLPQLSSILLIYLAYLSINLFIIPWIKKISFDDFEKLLTINVIKPIVAIAVNSYLLAIGVNIISYYAKPHLFNYSTYNFLAVCGYNDKPLSNLFFGFDRAIVHIILFTALASLRELIIWFIERSNVKREFRVLIANNTTPIIIIYLLILLFTDPIHESFRIYFACLTPIFLLYIYLTFWLFPLSWKDSFAGRFKIQIHVPAIIRLLLSTYIATLPLIFGFDNDERPFPFLAYWAFLLFIVTPLIWLLYQQRKDKIMRLRGMETALAKSNANLQFLRSQINPHFLFNALNTLYGTALKENAEHSAEGIQKLGDMMRFMLHENNLDFISMDKEIDYLKNYILLQKLRTQSSPDILIEDNIDDAKCNRTIAPMLLIPFVENAFKHGISLKEKSWINIKLECAETFISFEVRNSIHKRFETDTESEKSSIGLKNVAERLKLLYPAKHELNVSEDKNQFIVKLTIK